MAGLGVPGDGWSWSAWRWLVLEYLVMAGLGVPGDGWSWSTW